MSYRPVSSQVVHRNPFFRVIKEVFAHPQLKSKTYYTLQAPSFCAALPLNPAGHPGLVKVYRFALRRYGWELPGGGRDRGETTLEAAQREMREETGYTAKLYRPLGLPFALANGAIDILCYPYIAQDLRLVGQPDPEEITEFKFFSPRQIKQMIKSGEIIDAATLVALHRAGIV